MATVGEAIEQRNAGVLARLVQKISNALLTGAYRHDPAAWDPLQEAEGLPSDLLPPELQQGEGHKPYFEVLVVTPNDPNRWERARNELKRPAPAGRSVQLRGGPGRQLRGRGPRRDLQPQHPGRGDLRRLPVPLPPRPAGPARIPAAHTCASIRRASTPGALATTLARAIKNFRPELDIYLPDRPGRREPRRQRRSRADPADVP